LVVEHAGDVRVLYYEGVVEDGDGAAYHTEGVLGGGDQQVVVGDF
jgi:hypothetical protein